MSLKNFSGFTSNEERVAAKPRSPWASPSRAEQAEIEARKDARRAARSGPAQAELAAAVTRAELAAAAGEPIATHPAPAAESVIQTAAEAQVAEETRVENEAILAKALGEDSAPAPLGGAAATGDAQPDKSEPVTRKGRKL